MSVYERPLTTQAPIAEVTRWGRLAAALRDRENLLISLVSITAFLILWELLPALGLVKPLFTSSPSRILAAGQWLFANGLWRHIAVSAQEFGAGYALAVLTAVPMGILLGWYRRPRAALEPFISALYATPRIALMPILIIWLGIGIKSKIAVVFLGVFFPVIVNILVGMRTIDHTLLRCARAFGASNGQIFRTLALPTSVPFMISGMRLGVGRGLVGVVVGEMIASTAGIGHMMSIAGATFQTDKVYVGVILLASTGLFLTEVLKMVERRFDAWRPQR